MIERTSHDSYAIFETGGKQYQAVVGKTIAIEKLDAEPGATVEFSTILFHKSADGKFNVGAPYVNGVIRGTIVKHLRGPKLIAFRFKRRQKVRVKRGHRQHITVFRPQEIVAKGA